MASDWIETSLGNVVELKRGYDLPRQDRRAGSVPLVSSSGVSDFHAESMVKGPGVVTGRYGTLGQVFFVPDDFWPLNTTLYVRDFRGNDPRFISYFLRELDFRAYSDKAAVPGLNRNHLHQARVRIPSDVGEQRAIAHILGSLDDKIELNRRISETLEAMARALFMSWFVDFDPVIANSEGASSGLSRSITDLFPDDLVDSELGKIPRGWTVKSVGDLAEVVGGSTPSTGQPVFWEDGHHYWATPKDLSGLSAPVLLETERRITGEGLAEIGSGLLPEGTVLLSSRAPIGYLAIASVPVSINQGFIAMKPRPGVPSQFLLLWARSAHDQIVSFANGSTFLEISKAAFRPIRLIVPSAVVLAAFEELVKPWFDRIVLNEKASRNLAALRDALLPKLISGEIRIKPRS